MLQLGCSVKKDQNKRVNTMLKKVEQYIEKWQMLTADDIVIAGVSGGADSMCLLFVLNELQKKIPFQIVTVHVNHGIRGPEADADEEYVKRVCGQLHVSCEVVRENVKAFAEREKLSEEEAGRIVRRSAYEMVMEKYHGTRIALAHHQDDNVETFFLNLARGSRLKGLGGISPVNGLYIRPLLCVGRREIEAYLEKTGVSYCMDATNLEDTYTRNRIRNHIVPLFKKYINEKTVEHTNGAMEQMREIWCYLEKKAQEAADEYTCEKEQGILVRKELSGVEEPICGMVLRRVLVRVSGQEKDLEEVHVNAVKQLLDRQVGRSVDLPYRMRAVRTYEGVNVYRKAVEENIEPAECLLQVQEGEKAEIQYGKWIISWRVFRKMPEMDEPPKKTYTKWFDYDIIEKNVIVRTRRAGDRIVIDERGNSKKLKSYFVDEKIPAKERAVIPVIAEDRQILWIVGYRQSKAYQVTEQTTTILEISINGGNRDGREN